MPDKLFMIERCNTFCFITSNLYIPRIFLKEVIWCEIVAFYSRIKLKKTGANFEINVFI